MSGRSLAEIQNEIRALELLTKTCQWCYFRDLNDFCSCPPEVKEGLKHLHVEANKEIDRAGKSRPDKWRIWGKFYNYPECCISFFVYIWMPLFDEQAPVDSYWTTAYKKRNHRLGFIRIACPWCMAKQMLCHKAKEEQGYERFEWTQEADYDPRYLSEAPPRFHRQRLQDRGSPLHRNCECE